MVRKMCDMRISTTEPLFTGREALNSFGLNWTSQNRETRLPLRTSALNESRSFLSWIWNENACYSVWDELIEMKVTWPPSDMRRGMCRRAEAFQNGFCLCFLLMLTCTDLIILSVWIIQSNAHTHTRLFSFCVIMWLCPCSSAFLMKSRVLLVGANQLNWCTCMDVL